MATANGNGYLNATVFLGLWECRNRTLTFTRYTAVIGDSYVQAGAHVPESTARARKKNTHLLPDSPQRRVALCRPPCIRKGIARLASKWKIPGTGAQARGAGPRGKRQLA